MIELLNTIEINGKQYETFNFDDIDRSQFHGFIYVTINKINGKKYVGQHTKWDPDYIGSGGRYFRFAINKYGRENFIRYIIDLAKTQEELDEKETFYINEEFDAVKSDDWYNTKDGAQHGGNPFAGFNEEDRKRISEIRSKQVSGKNNPLYGRGYLIEGDKNGMRKCQVNFEGENNPFYGRSHSKESIEKIRKANIGHKRSVGKKNGMYGKKGKDNPGTRKVFALLPTGETIEAWGTTEMNKRLKELGYNVPISSINGAARKKLTHKRSQIKFWR